MANNVYCGFRFLLSRHTYNVIQLRVLYSIIRYAQSELQGVTLRENMCKIEYSLRDVVITTTAREYLDEKSHHYEDVHNAIMDMQHDVIVYNDGRITRSTTLLQNVEIHKGSGRIIYSVANWVWGQILDFAQGYKRIDYDLVMSLRLRNSILLLQLISGNKKSLHYPVEWLKQYFGVADRYSKTSDFFIKVLRPAAAELNDTKRLALSITPDYQGGRSIAAYQIKVDQLPDRAQLLGALSPRDLSGDSVYYYMRYSLGYTHDELKRNKALLDDAAHLLHAFLGLLVDLKDRAAKGFGGQRMGKGWIINAIKGEVCKKREAKT